LELSVEDVALHSALVTIDLGALKSNYKTLSAEAKTAHVGVAIKGEAYGLGMARCARVFWDAGCRHFFVARPLEGADLRAVLPEANIYVLDGFYLGQAAFYVQHNLLPALASLAEAIAWKVESGLAPCAIHLDTGINRLGFTPNEFADLCNATELLKSIDIRLLISHLACSDESGHQLNLQQLQAFQNLRKLLPEVPASFANSSGIYLGAEYHYDIVRAGVALYGGNPLPGKLNPMKAVVTLQAKVMQVRDVQAGHSIGYSATWVAPRNSRIAILGAGYRDGIPRKLSSSRVDGPAQVYLNGKRCAIIGRVSMDMMACDVTDTDVKLGDMAEIFGAHVSVDEAAASAGTISYELLTHLGNRYARNYVN
jgi:alanine racemase